MPESEHLELVRGVLSNESPPGVRHGWIQIKLGGALFAFVQANDLGEVYGEVGIILQHDPDTVLAPDLTFVSKANLSSEVMEAGYLHRAPDLVVEIVSPSDNHSQVVEKVMTYLEAGVPLVWEVDPQRKRVIVWQGDHTVLELKPGDTLQGGDILSGFELPVSDLFPR